MKFIRRKYRGGIFDTYQAYLIDDDAFISVCPCPLFEVIDDRIATNWHFRLLTEGEDAYPYIQAIFGYDELCLERNAYENLIVEKEERAQHTYFMRKIEMKNGLI